MYHPNKRKLEINFNLLPDWVKYESLRGKELREGGHVLDDMRHTCHVLDTYYENFDLHKAESKIKNLSEEERVIIHGILSNY